MNQEPIKNLEDALELYNQGRRASSKGDRQLAIGKFKESYRLFPHFKTFELLGEALLSEGEYAEAIVYLAAAAGIGENQFRARFLLAKALIALGSHAESDALNQLRKSIKLNKNYKAAKQLLQKLLQERKVKKKNPDKGDAQCGVR